MKQLMQNTPRSLLFLTRIFFTSTLLVTIALGNKALAANTSGVHGPNVDANDRSMQLRLALSPGDEDGQTDNWGYRLHYQHSLNDRVRGRVIVQFRDRSEFQYEYLRGEILYNFKKRADQGIWSSGVRFDIRQRRSDNPEEFAVNWTNQWDLANGIRIRGILIGAWQFGSDRAFSGTEIETRSSISKKLENGLRVGVEMFNEFGEIGDFGSFDEQSHQIGPFIGGSVAGFKYEFRYLAGVSDATRDHNFGLRFNKSF
ncbi:hypothetical protein ACFO4O_09525 [Glaciecola siphonariae]|uniref:DUF2490 domain-containing protein n=1 Tax=Glaciecola siphonariae TaxID=521012 RepID=A0ABV9LX17_9ALTE